MRDGAHEGGERPQHEPEEPADDLDRRAESVEDEHARLHRPLVLGVFRRNRSVGHPRTDLGPDEAQEVAHLSPPRTAFQDGA